MGAKETILEEIRRFPGQAGIYYHSLVSGETWGYRDTEPYLAASIVKLPLMAAILLWKSRGTDQLRRSRHHPGRSEDPRLRRGPVSQRGRHADRGRAEQADDHHQ